MLRWTLHRSTHQSSYHSRYSAPEKTKIQFYKNYPDILGRSIFRRPSWNSHQSQYLWKWRCSVWYNAGSCWPWKVLYIGTCGNLFLHVFHFTGYQRINYICVRWSLGPSDDRHLLLLLPNVYIVLLRIAHTFHYINPAVVTSLQFEGMISDGTSSAGLPAAFLLILVQFVGAVLGSLVFKKVYLSLYIKWKSKLMEDWLQCDQSLV